MPVYYTCPFCGRDTTLTDSQISEEVHALWIQNADGPHVLTSTFRVCPNLMCRKFSLRASLAKSLFESITAGQAKPGKLVHSWTLIPPSSAKAFPQYIPEPIRNDYEEACLIRDGSPKASATLSRRCLQGMIRDFWDIKKNRLVDEIAELKSKVYPEVWDAIDAVRQIGNIGAHMEKDVNLIVDVEPEEADRLIWLIEYLMREWYIQREGRRAGLEELKKIAESKKSQQLGQEPQVT